MNFNNDALSDKPMHIKDFFSLAKNSDVPYGTSFETDGLGLVTYENSTKKEIDGSNVVVYDFSILSAIEVQLSIGTTGLQGGDAGHGGRTYLFIGSDEYSFPKTELILEGDMELESLLTAMKLFISLADSTK